jgi:PAS domain S-box-containing protein
MRLRRGIGLRLLVRVLLFSSVITLLLTLSDLYLDYRYDVGTIEDRLTEIEVSYRQSMAESLWNVDRQQVQLQANGILSYPDVSFVEVREAESRASAIVVSVGQPNAHAPLRRVIPLFHSFNGTNQQLGVMVVEASLDDVYRSLFHRLSVILVNQAAKTFLVSFFILYITYQLVTRHLVDLARNFAHYDPRERTPPLRLKRRAPGEPDELDQVVLAFQGMSRNLERLYDDLRRSEADYRGIYETALEGIARISPAGEVLSANPAFARIFGFASSEEAVRCLTDFGRQCWPDPHEWQRLVTMLGEQGAAIGREVELARADQQHIWVSISARAQRGENGELRYVDAIISDVTVRKEMEKALRASQQRFRDYAEIASDWFWETDAEHALVYLSDQFGSFSGGLASLIGKHRWEIADDVESEPEKWIEHRNMLDRHEPFRDFVYRSRHLGDEVRFVSISGKPIWDEQHRFLGYRGVTKDVTQRVVTESERQESLSFFEGMDRVNRATQGTGDLDEMMHNVLESVLGVFACDRAWLVYPCDPAATTWRPVMERTRPDWPCTLPATTHLPVDAEVVRVFEVALQSPDAVRFGPGQDEPLPARVAEQFSIQSMIGMAVYPRGDQPYLFGLHQCSHMRVWTAHEQRLFQAIGLRIGDALTSLLMLRNLRDSEAKLEGAQRIAHVGHWDLEIETNELTWSNETWRIMGVAPRAEKMRFTDELSLVHPDDRARVEAAVAAALAGESVYAVEFRVMRANGEIRTVQSQARLVTDPSGRPARLFGTMQDITERKRAEALLSESERRYREVLTALAHANRLSTVGQFTAEIAHEIRQPITAAAANAAAAVHWLRAQPPNLDEARRALGAIVEDAMRVSDVIGRIRKLVTKAPAGEGFLDINEAILEVVALIKSEAEKHSVSVQTQLAEGLPLVFADRVQMQQAVLNLISNAIDAMRSADGARQLLIKTQTEGADQIHLIVQDSGPGFSDDCVKRIFDPFYTTKADGMGMGLSICRSIVHAHGGRVWATPNPTGGAIFHVVIPVEGPGKGKGEGPGSASPAS